MKRIFVFFVTFIILLHIQAQDTTIVQTFTFDSLGRDYVFSFPEDTGQTYEKIFMQYTMRCK